MRVSRALAATAGRAWAHRRRAALRLPAKWTASHISGGGGGSEVSGSKVDGEQGMVHGRVGQSGRQSCTQCTWEDDA